MSGELIPDPTDETKPAIYADEKGTRLAPAVQMCRVREGSEPPTAAELMGDDWSVIGYATDLNSADPPTREDRP